MTNYLASIDPGKHACSVATWLEGQLTSAIMVENPFESQNDGDRWANLGRLVGDYLHHRIPFLSHHTWDLVIEVPEIYPGVREENPNDLIQLAGVLGAICGRMQANCIWCPHPKQWKGQLPKAVSKKRVDSKLSDLEKSRITWPKAKSLHHNVYDAIHLGLVYLKR